MKILLKKNVKLKDKNYFFFENGIWTGNKSPFRKIKILRNTNFNDQGYFDFSDVAEIEIEAKFFPRKALINNDILIERSGGGPNTPVGRVALYNGTDNLFSFSNFTTRLRVVSKDIDPIFLHYHLLYFHLSGKTEKIQTQTTNIRNLEFDKYISFEIKLPETKGEQEYIASEIKDKLNQVEQMHQAATKQKEAAKALQGALLREVFPYKEGDELPEGWKWEKIGNIITEERELLQPNDPDFKSLPFIGLENIKSNTREYTNEEYNPPSSTCFKFLDKHVLYGKLRPYLNKVFLPENKGKCSMEILPLIPKDNYDRSFIAAILQSEAVLGNTIKFSTGGRMPRADINRLKKLAITIPIDSRKCNEIGERVANNIDKVIQINKILSYQIEAIETLPSAILREVFDFNN